MFIFFLSCPSGIMTPELSFHTSVDVCDFVLCIFFWCVCIVYVYILCDVVYVCSVCVCAHIHILMWLYKGHRTTLLSGSTILYFIPLRKNLPLKVELGGQSASRLLPPLPMHCSSKYEHDHGQPLTVDIWLRFVCLPSNHSFTMGPSSQPLSFFNTSVG